MSCLRLILFGSALALTAAPAAAQDVETRLRALEARVSALEGRAAPAASSASGAPGPACRRLNVNGSSITPGATLTVTVNGATVATFDENAYGDLESFMRPGPNTVGLAFATPGGAGTSAELRCLPPNVASSRTVILRLKPTATRLSAQAQVNLSER